ncbi:MAG TPA: hypothetical protein VL096_15400 [Pirellulaceae bacterium]|nr:hypothetical protein [Pirellulaceae bacterium]
MASEIYGLPSDLTVDQVIDSSLAHWQPDQQWLDALLPVEGFPIPVVTPFPKDEQANWDWHRRWLEAGLASGGSLYFARRTEGPMCWFDYYYVVKEARILAWMQTSIFLV